ncbi:unnamed protein product [Bursaphelenchus xylophilus]|uniref:(pine wood nematode) hypothetical protein n=1 Tax=Bursaphelenchus xylophilus TaxID=6326 RepID=A0A7I8WWQ5_BURXY|nr:unnamed protein product [Bursaphelenchus xylophilus]CAG9099296.1 unnamed protein product [Bursaphelenchus xylophilus]
MEIQTLGALNTPPPMMDPRIGMTNTLCPPESTLWMGDMNKFNLKVKNVKFVTDKNTGKLASYCFVEFCSEEDARTALLQVNGRHVPNDEEKRRFHLSFANSPDPHLEFNLFVSNLHRSVDEVVLFKLFGEKYKSCRGAKVYRNPDGSSKETGFIRFMSETDQQMALVEMNKVKVKGKELQLKLAPPKTRVGGGRTARGGGPGYSGRGNPPFGMSPGVQMGFGGPVNPAYGQMGSQFPSAYAGFSGGPPLTSYNSRDYRGSSRRGLGRGRDRRSRSPTPERPEPKIFIEPVDPPTPRELNEFIMQNEWDLQMALDKCRFSKILIPTDLKAKDLGVQLYEMN